MATHRPSSSALRALTTISFLALACVAAWGPACSAPRTTGTLILSIVDGASGKPTPARVELLDANKNAYIAGDALLVGQGYADRKTPWRGNLDQALALLSREMKNPYTRTTQFYSAGNSTFALPPGAYTLRIYKGTEYELVTRQIEIQAGKVVEVEAPLSRWVNMPEQGWYSADDHLHISRPVKDLNPVISKWMQAEDIHVANLLQFGTRSEFLASPQYEHGPAGIYQEGDYVIASGQENPRTDFLGHGLVLGAQSPIHLADQYVIYKSTWEEARRQGALSGYAHWGTGSGALTGLAIDLPYKLLDFIEVLEGSDANFDVWYDILNTGFRMTPTAGTDFGSVPALPGRERFFAKVEGALNYPAWLDAIRRGRTFVTNGPVLEFRVQGKEIGDEVALDRPASVQVEARVRFDPARDNVLRLEVIQNGYLAQSLPRQGPVGEIAGKFELDVRESSWLALRASGHKLGEAVPEEGLLPPYRDRYRGAYASHAHTAPIYVTIQNAPGISQRPAAKALARSWIARLEDLKVRLAEDQIQYLAEPGAENDSSMNHLKKNRDELLKVIETAKGQFVLQSQ